MKKLYIYGMLAFLVTIIVSCNSGSVNNQGGGSTTTLSIESVSPQNGESNISIYSDIIVKFNQPIAKLTTAMIAINESSPNGNTVPIYSIQAESTANSYKISLSSPLDGLTNYYVTLNSQITTTDGKHLAATTIHFTTKNPQWVMLGGSISPIQQPLFDFPNMALASDGSPYIIYQPTNSQQVLVSRYSASNNNWESLGIAQTFTATNTSYFSSNITISANNIPYIAYLESTTLFVIKQYVDGEWRQVDAGIPFADRGADGTGTGNGNSLILNLSSDNRIYTGSITSRGLLTPLLDLQILGSKLSGESWQQIGSNFVNFRSNSPLNMAISANNKKYLGYSDNSGINIKLYAESTNNWITLGNPRNNNFSQSRKFFDLTIAPDNTPYLAYYIAGGTSSNVTIAKYVNESWVNVTAPQVLATSPIKLVITNRNDMYLVFGTNGEGVVHIMRYNSVNNTWTNVGTAIPGSGANLLISNDGEIYVAVYLVGNKLNVMKFY